MAGAIAGVVIFAVWWWRASDWSWDSPEWGGAILLAVGGVLAQVAWNAVF